MLHPDTELRFVNPVIGYGIFATHLIPKGTITWVRDDLDQTFEPEEIRKMPKPYQQILDKYTFVDGTGKAVLCWDLARYINHCCAANCLGAGYDFEVAVRDIHPGEELTDDYGTLNVETSFECFCGVPDCRRVIHPEDLLHHGARYDELLAAAFPHIFRVRQPLAHFLRNRAEVEEAASNPALMRSSRANYSRNGIRV